MSNDPNLILLKKYVLLKASILGLTPSDCKRLAIIISKEVNKNISETTLKRLFGFAEVKHKFSKFTLTALSEYVGKNSWDHFCETVNENPSDFVLSKWDELFYKSRSLTHNALKAIRNRSGIPFQFTVVREFAERNFNDFYTNDYSFTGFISQPGYGKSILLCHLLDNLFLKEDGIYKDDMVWFIDVNTLFNSELFDFDLDYWLNEQIGGGYNFLNYFNEDPLKRKGKVVIILDGFDVVSIKKSHLNSLLNRISTFICSNQENDWVKIVLSMRTTTWITFYEHIRHSAYLKSKLYSGNQVMMDSFANIPPLSDKEIDIVLGKFSNIDVSQINKKLKAQFRYPFYLQVYYQLKEDGRTFDYTTDLTYYELISGFVNEKINLSQHYTEKILLLKKAIVLSKQIRKGNLVYKENLLNDITVFREAYEQLLIDGILIEEKLSDHIMPKEIVRFIHSDIYEYFLFIQIIDNNQRNINSQLFEYLRLEYEKSPLRLQLFQWSVRHAIINQNINPIIEILKLKLPGKEKNKLMLFILQMVEFKASAKNGTNKIIDENLHKAFMEELIQLDLFGPCYKEILQTLKRLTVNSNEKLIYGSLLAYIAVLELNSKQLLNEINDLKLIVGGGHKWLIKPSDAFEAIFNKLNNINSENSQIDFAIEKFINQPKPLQKTEITYELTISYIMMFLINYLSGNLVSNLRVFKQIKAQHANVFIKRNGLSIYVLNLTFVSGLKLPNNESSARIIDLLERLQEDKKNELPDYINVLFLMARAEFCVANTKYEEAIDFADKCLEISKIKNIPFLKILAYILQSNVYEQLEDTERARDYRYELHCLLEDKKIDVKCFIHNHSSNKVLN